MNQLIQITTASDYTHLIGTVIEVSWADSTFPAGDRGHSVTGTLITLGDVWRTSEDGTVIDILESVFYFEGGQRATIEWDNVKVIEQATIRVPREQS